MGHDLASGNVVKFKDVGNHFAGGFFDDAPFLALVHHHEDFLLGHAFVLRVRVEAQQPEYTIGGLGQKPDKRLGHHRDAAQNARHLIRDALRPLHGDALRDQLSEYQRQKRQQQGNDYGGDAGDDAGRDGQNAVERRGDLFRKGGGRHSGGEEPGEGHAHLNGGEEVGRVGGHPHKDARFFVAVLRVFFELVVVEGDDGDLRRGKEGVEEDQEHQNEQLEQRTSEIACLLGGDGSGEQYSTAVRIHDESPFQLVRFLFYPLRVLCLPAETGENGIGPAKAFPYHNNRTPCLCQGAQNRVFSRFIEEACVFENQFLFASFFIPLHC